MLNEIWFNIQYGMHHVLDINAYDHVLFLVALTVSYTFKNWKKVLLLITFFTIGHTLSLLLGAYKMVQVSATIVEFLIPVSILITAIYSMITAKKPVHSKLGILAFVTLFFGFIHGLGFAREFLMFAGNNNAKLPLLIEFALGIELAQIIVVTVCLMLSYLFQTVFNVTKRDWILVVSAIIIGLVIPMILNSDFLQA